MGNEQGKPSGNMGMSAVACVCTVQESHLTAFEKKFRKNAGDMITREHLKEATDSFDDLEAVDVALLDKLFTMFDVTGDGNVNYKDYLAGLTPLSTGSAKEKLHLAMKLFDAKRIGTISRAELRRLIIAINNVASYFGDPVVRDIEISSLVSDIFRMQSSSSSAIKYEDFFDAIYDHNTTHAFVMGKGTQRFGVKQ